MSEDNLPNKCDNSIVNNSFNMETTLRRKSLGTYKAQDLELSENDDNAERLMIRKNNISHITSVSNRTNNRRSLEVSKLLTGKSISQISEQMFQYIRFNAENKINLKNAFDLEMIDCMAIMAKRNDQSFNLQLASSALDISTKIYGYRIDKIHSDVLKMVGGLDDEQENKNLKENDMVEIENSALQSVVKKKKKLNQKIISTVESLTGKINIQQPVWTSSMDTQTTDVLCQATLPNHAQSGYYLHNFNDIILDDINEEKQYDESLKFTVHTITNLSDFQLCTPFHNFKFSDEFEMDNDEKENKQNSSINSFHFNLDSSVTQDENFSTSLNDFNGVIDNVQLHDNLNEPVNVVNFNDVILNSSASKISEYRFIPKSISTHWAGPSHWKIKSVQMPHKTHKSQENINPMTKKKDNFEIQFNNDILKNINPKLCSSEKILLKLKNVNESWQKKDITYPRDIHYDVEEFHKLYVKLNCYINYDKRETLEITHVSDNENYDYNNENDSSNYCPQLSTREYDNNNQELENNFDFNEDCFIGKNLINIPRTIDKISIPYSLRTKKLDMKQLKNSIWSFIKLDDKENKNTNEEEKESSIKSCDALDEVPFSEIYSQLPNILNKNITEELSFPTAFVSLLHLANEKTLKVNISRDQEDITVKIDKKIT